MSDSLKVLLADNPNAPRIPHKLYTLEKANLCGNFIGAFLYGTLAHVNHSVPAYVFPTHGLRSHHCPLLQMYERAAQYR